MKLLEYVQKSVNNSKYNVPFFFKGIVKFNTFPKWFNDRLDSIQSSTLFKSYNHRTIKKFNNFKFLERIS